MNEYFRDDIHRPIYAQHNINEANRPIYDRHIDDDELMSDFGQPKGANPYKYSPQIPSNPIKTFSES